MAAKLVAPQREGWRDNPEKVRQSLEAFWSPKKVKYGQLVSQEAHGAKRDYIGMEGQAALVVMAIPFQRETEGPPVNVRYRFRVVQEEQAAVCWRISDIEALRRATSE